MMFRLREVVKVLLNFYWFLAGRLYTFFGAVDFPIPPNSNMRRTSAKNLAGYIYSSNTTALPIVTAASMSGFRFNQEDKILDFGCGVAGQLRYMTKFHPNPKYYASDIDPSSVRWVAKNYPDVSVSLNGPRDPLNYDDNFFDLIYTVSTFSHFSKDDVGFWLEELRRVTKPGGLLIATIEGVSAAKVVADELAIDVSSIENALSEDGIYYKTYSWLPALKSRGKAINANVDISTYFPDEYGQTVMTTNYFCSLASKHSWEYLGSADEVICNRQDLICLRRR